MFYFINSNNKLYIFVDIYIPEEELNGVDAFKELLRILIIDFLGILKFCTGSINPSYFGYKPPVGFKVLASNVSGSPTETFTVLNVESIGPMLEFGAWKRKNHAECTL